MLIIIYIYNSILIKSDEQSKDTIVIFPCRVYLCKPQILCFFYTEKQPGLFIIMYFSTWNGYVAAVYGG